MNSKERRNLIYNKLLNIIEPHKGSKLAQEFGVTRQVIVKDIAILRAEGKNIVSTPDGYLIMRDKQIMKERIIAVTHDLTRIREELEIIINNNGMIRDVIVEHPLYGEIKGMLMIKSLNDIDNFMNKFTTQNAEPLSTLTGGIHLHTIAAEDEETLNNIIIELKNKKFIEYD
jgi:Predicted small molecule binding protein (contains 3H domain)